MASIVTRLGDRMLRAFVPAARAAASNGSKCVCQCSDACFYCCPTTDPDTGLPTYRCNVASGSQCM